MSKMNLRREYFEDKVYLTDEKDSTEFDVIIDEKSCSSYRSKGVFCDSCFNDKLIDKMQDYNSLQRLSFINYQLNKQKDPLDWLKRMKAFLYDNEDEFNSFNYKCYLEYVQIVEEGITQLSEKKDEGKKKAVKTSTKNLTEFVDSSRIDELKNLKSDLFDFRKLINYCEEINVSYENEAYISVAMLTRAIIDHIPPIFGADNFQNVYGQNGSKSFKANMTHLDKSLRKIADSYLHSHIKKKEMLPNKTQVNFSQDIDVLLAEICSIM